MTSLKCFSSLGILTIVFARGLLLFVDEDLIEDRVLFILNVRRRGSC